MRNILNIAHRGFTKVFPDNTLEAFEAAIQIGVDGIECDVQETADHRFVVFHDSELLGQDIGKLSLGEIQNVKLKGKFKIPTLEQTLDLCKKRVRVVVELKKVQMVDRLLRLSRSIMEPTEIIIASFNRDLVSKTSNQAPEIETAIITSRPPEDLIRLAESAECDIIIVRFPFATAELAEKVHAHNLSIFVWDCAGLRDVIDALGLDINGIISDFPDLVMKELGRAV
jgi:glycerophosphoryl diester phosphodiesterase